MQAEAIEVIDKEEVLLAKTQFSETVASKDVKTFFLISRFSTMASIIRSHSEKDSNVETNFMLLNMASLFSDVIFCFSANLINRILN